MPQPMDLLSVEEDAVEEAPMGIDDESGGDEQTDCKSHESGGDETDSKGGARGGDETDCKSDEGGGDIFSDEDDNEELGDLPLEIAGMIGKKRFQSEAKLQQALDQAGFGDLRVVLIDGKPRLVMPSHQHNAFTSKYARNFANKWGKNRWGCCSATHKIDLLKGSSRDPDLSYWGFPRCNTDTNGDLEPTGCDSVPDVVIQFSWRNTKKYETDAMNEMMEMALESSFGAESTTRPTLGYLIKVKFADEAQLRNKKKRKRGGGAKRKTTTTNPQTPTPEIQGTIEGLYIYRLPHGTTVADASNNTNGASVRLYTPGDPEYLITITPADLGITGFWAYMCGNYTIKASDLLTNMQDYHEGLKKAEKEKAESHRGLGSTT